MSTAMPFDEDLTRRLVEMYTTAEVLAQRGATLEILNPRPGERVLDIGSGPGFLAAGIASRVGEAGAVSGIDLSEPMVAYASALAAAPGAAPMTFALGDATALGYPDQSFDAVRRVRRRAPGRPGAVQPGLRPAHIQRRDDAADRQLRPGPTRRH